LMLLEKYGCFVSSCIHDDDKIIASLFWSSSYALNLWVWACLMMSEMYCLRKVAMTPKKKVLSGSLLESCYLLGRYFASTSSFIASS
jgi:hypothetical protein